MPHELTIETLEYNMANWREAMASNKYQNDIEYLHLYDTSSASEAWLFNNPDAIASVQRGLNDAAQGRVSKVDPDTL
jgi:hypothetical protein